MNIEYRFLEGWSEGVHGLHVSVGVPPAREVLQAEAM